MNFHHTSSNRTKFLYRRVSNNNNNNNISFPMSILVLFLACVSYLKYIQLCMGEPITVACFHNVRVADTNQDAILNSTEFIQLSQLYKPNHCGVTNSVDLDVPELVLDNLNTTQQNVFLNISTCFCSGTSTSSSTPPVNTNMQDCCTMDNSIIYVNTVYKDITTVSFAERFGIAIVCMQASMLAQELYLDCNTTSTTIDESSSMPMISPPPQQPSVVSDTPSNTPSPPPSTESPMLPPVGDWDIPVSVPTESPNSLPVALALPTDSPTSSPMLPPSGGWEIPVALPTDSPSSSPVLPPAGDWDIPVVITTPAPVALAPEPPTVPDFECINAMRIADSDQNKYLSFEEYEELLRLLHDCTNPLYLTVYQAFLVSRCYPEVRECGRPGIDLASFYKPRRQRAVTDRARIATICDIAERFFAACTGEGLPSPIPIERPVALPTNVPIQITNNPTDTPVITVTTLAPTNPPNTNIPAGLQSSGPTPTPTCFLHLKDSDIDSDLLLTETEFVSFIAKESGCDTITSLNQEQSELFNDIADNCLDVEGADPLCADPRNARVAINGDNDSLTAICLQILTVLSDTCTTAPIVMTSPVSTPFVVVPPLPTEVIPAPTGTIQTSAPVDGPPTVVNPDIVVPVINPMGTAPVALAPSPVALPPSTVSAPNTPVGTGPVNPVVPALGPVAPAPIGPGLPSPIATAPIAPSPIALVPGAPAVDPVTPPPIDSALPPLGVGSAPEECLTAMTESDIDNDTYLDEQEYLSFIRKYSKCSLITVLSADQTAVFYNLARKCLNEVGADPSCWLPGNAKVSISGSYEVCYLPDATVVDECVGPATMAPIEYVHLDQCSSDLVASDSDENGLINVEEYLQFIKKYVQCENYTSLDWGQYAVFQTMACECVNIEKSFQCCLPANATLNISGASLPDSNRSDLQTSTLSKICMTADGLTWTTRECAAETDIVEEDVECSTTIVSSDTNDDGFLDMEEYLLFMQATYTECSEVESLSFSQRVVFGIFACNCLKEPGATMDCCFPGNARINIDGAQQGRNQERTEFLSTFCRASQAVAEVGCRSVSPTFSPTIQTSNSATTFEPTTNAPTEVIEPETTTSALVATESADDPFDDVQHDSVGVSFTTRSTSRSSMPNHVVVRWFLLFGTVGVTLGVCFT